MKFKTSGRSFRSRIFISFMAALLPVLVLTFICIETLLVPYVESGVWEDLTNSTKALTNSIRATASVTIRNHLKAIAEKNRAVARQYYDLAEKGVITRQEAVNQLRRVLLEQTVGTSGYLYCVDSKGIAVVHPNPGVEGEDHTQFAFVREQMARKEGYIEYQWRNPGEHSPRPKALYMVYFEPLDWIISASSYRSEFNTLLTPDDFSEAVLSVRFGKSGYAYVVNNKGVAIIHPEIKGVKLFAQKDAPTEFLREMLARGSGIQDYVWKNPKDPYPRRKLAVFEKIPEFGWTIASSAYWDEVMEPVLIARYIGYGTMIMLLIMGVITSYLLSGRITKPIDSLIAQLDRNTKASAYGPLPVDTGSSDIDRLGQEFNAFLATIDAQNMEMENERARYLSLFEASPDAILLIRGVEIIDCNPATFEIFGGGKQEIIGKSIMDLSAPAQAGEMSSKALAASMFRALDNEPMQTFEWVHQALDGRTFDADVRLKHFNMHKGEPVLVAFVRDITDRKQAEKALAESEQRFRQVVEELPVPLFIQDFSEAKKAMDELVRSGVSDLARHFKDNHESLYGILGKVATVFVNQAAVDLYEAENKKALLKSMADVAPPKVSQHHIDQMVSFYNGNLLYEGYGQNKTMAGNILELLIKKVVVPGHEKNLTRLVSMALDLTEVKKAQREKENLESQLRQAQKMEAVGTLAGGIAHDFNNILSAIMGFSELAQLQARKGEDNEKHLARIVQAAERARDLVQQILTFSRKSEATLKPIDLNQLLIESKEILDRTIPKMVDIQMNLAGNIEYIKGDATQLEQVVMNLASNASDAMPDGGVLSFETKSVLLDREFAELHLGTEPGKYVLLSVSDTGHGMNKETTTKLFDPFFTTKGVGKGTGLGLSTVYGIVKEHGGHIYCYSEVGVGTNFNIYLPAIINGEKPDNVEDKDILDGIQGTETILLVDDESSLLEVNSSLLENIGYKVIRASSGEEAIGIYGENEKEIDLIIMDLGMPGMGGHRALKEIILKHPDAKVLIASGYSASSKLEDLAQDGASGFVPKPFRRMELLEEVRSVLDA
jgi:PAS domain S-box-containing protein